jgi:hypothetical protein
MTMTIVARATRTGLGLCALVMCFTAALPRIARSVEFTEAELFFELNDTDGDLGIHASIDGGPYVKLDQTIPKRDLRNRRYDRCREGVRSQGAAQSRAGGAT